uniref:Uncharacterized protein n=1 Tax=Mesocestoides corti TaxID=53468 RepID=A0A5K3ENH9_MESCO
MPLERRETEDWLRPCPLSWPRRSIYVYCSVGLGRRHVGPPGLSQSHVSLRSNGMR